MLHLRDFLTISNTYSVAITKRRITAEAVQIRETEVNCRPGAHGSSASSIKEIHKEWNGTTLKS